MTHGFIRAALTFLRLARRRKQRGGGAGTRTPARIPATERRRQFKDCSQAADALNSGTKAGSARSPFDGSPTRPRVVRNRDGSFTATAGVTWQLETSKATTTVTRPEWPNMTAADRAAADRFVDALKAHEEGHHQVVRDVMRGAPRNIRATGATADEAIGNLDAEMQNQTRRAQEKIDERNAAYDDKTDNGRNQAAVGGRNTALRCP
jgi:hypothetical protein